MRTRVTSFVASLVLLVAGAVVAIATAAPAAAAGRDGTCNSSEFCYYFNSGNEGSVSDFTGSIGDYGTTQPSCYEFKGVGNGQGRCVKNEAASAWNRSSKTVRVYFNSDYDGSHAYQDFAPGAKGNLNSTMKNNNASHEFRTSTAPPSGCHTDGTDTTLPSSILVYRAGSGAVERVAFKTYVKNVLPNEWIASWPAESLKAGAMAVKTFGWYWALHSTRRTSDGRCFDVYDSTSSQVYKPGSATSSTSSAVDATWGARMSRSGNIFEAHYCSDERTCGDYATGEWMSQNGSKDQADAGSDYRAILRPTTGTSLWADRRAASRPG